MLQKQTTINQPGLRLKLGVDSKPVGECLYRACMNAHTYMHTQTNGQVENTMPLTAHKIGSKSIKTFKKTKNYSSQKTEHLHDLAFGPVLYKYPERPTAQLSLESAVICIHTHAKQSLQYSLKFYSTNYY